MNFEYTKSQKESMKKIADFHLRISIENQILKTIEENASLMKMLCKYALKEIDYEDLNLLDELFDAEFMIFQMKKILLKDEYTVILFNKIVNEKIDRELKRWGLEDA